MILFSSALNFLINVLPENAFMSRWDSNLNVDHSFLGTFEVKDFEFLCVRDKSSFLMKF